MLLKIIMIFFIADAASIVTELHFLYISSTFFNEKWVQ